LASKPLGLPDWIRFGDDFELDVRAYELRSAGTSLKLNPIPMELLLFLIERRGELVTRDQIVERIWGKGVFLDSDNSINNAISKIRQVLRDDPEHPHFVQTVTGRGYRFIAPVAVRDSSVAENPATDVPGAAQGTVVAKPVPPSITPAIIHRRWPVILGILLAMLVALSAYVERVRSHSRSQTCGGRLMLAVLPFENLTGDANQDYFCDGLTEEMITQLGQLDAERMGVIGRTSVMHYKHNPEALDKIGRELGVQYVLEGSVRSASDRVRITAQLLQVKDQTHLSGHRSTIVISKTCWSFKARSHAGSLMRSKSLSGIANRSSHRGRLPYRLSPMRLTICISRASISGIRGQRRDSNGRLTTFSRPSPKTPTTLVRTPA
jgi:TolB-like protein/DNA-binding winged helix-turn-helix (wHTH) protein